MSKFLDRMERISSGAGAPMGFGAAPREKLPGLALVGQVSGDHTAAIPLLAQLLPDGVLFCGLSGPPDLKELGQALASVPWGARLSSLNEEEARAYREGGCDLLAFPLLGTSVAAVATEELARILCVDPPMEEADLRAIDSLPIDVLLLSMNGISGTWTLRDLATVAAVSRRTNKYVLVESPQLPSPPELEALRNAGVRGLVVDLGSSSPEALAQLKTALLEMPRHRPSRRDRPTAILPGFTHSSEPAPHHEEEDEEEE